jgi:hypothetical protein
MLRNTYFPTTIVDGFFDNPNAIREFALNQEYSTDTSGRWPGIRTKPLSEISPYMFHNFCQKMLSLFITSDQGFNYNIEATFQLINKDYMSGWVHKDASIATAIIYLNPESDSGTSLYLKQDIDYDETSFVKEKKEGYKNNSDNNIARSQHNQHFKETVSIKGIFNRLIIFDSNIYHSAHDFFGVTKENSRLTLVCFVHSLSGDINTPLSKSRNFSGCTL